MLLLELSPASLPTSGTAGENKHAGFIGTNAAAPGSGSAGPGGRTRTRSASTRIAASQPKRRTKAEPRQLITILGRRRKEASVKRRRTPRQAVYGRSKPAPQEKHENKQKATQDVRKSERGRGRISKSDAGAASKITRKTNVKPENRKTIFGFGIRTATQRDRSWRGQTGSAPELDNLSKRASHAGPETRAWSRVC